jgi:hypothetical protein
MTLEDWQNAALLYMKAYLALRWAIYDSDPRIQRDSLILAAVNAAAALIAQVPEPIKTELGKLYRADTS